MWCRQQDLNQQPAAYIRCRVYASYLAHMTRQRIIYGSLLCRYAAAAMSEKRGIFLTPQLA